MSKTTPAPNRRSTRTRTRTRQKKIQVNSYKAYVAFQAIANATTRPFPGMIEFNHKIDAIATTIHEEHCTKSTMTDTSKTTPPMTRVAAPGAPTTPTTTAPLRTTHKKNHFIRDTHETRRPLCKKSTMTVKSTTAVAVPGAALKLAATTITPSKTNHKNYIPIKQQQFIVFVIPLKNAVLSAIRRVRKKKNSP